MSNPSPLAAPSVTRLGRRRVRLPDQAFVVTWMTRDRRPRFEDLALSRRVIGTMRELEEAGHVRSMAWVLMPDHLHWLVQPEGRGELDAALDALRRASGGADLWAGEFHVEAVPETADIRQVSRDIVANPLRWGLAESLADYPHWDAIWI
ncbi:transposase [Ectothiorhodospiraceae bacterium WFHF3C12]|nr:transposase [Ectothiorhodospiraceae bacterium WFHF3C12]